MKPAIFVDGTGATIVRLGTFPFCMHMQSPYGYFSKDGFEFVVTSPATPRAFDNFLWNETVYSNVHQTGVGCMDYQIGETEGIQLLTGVGRVCDYDVFGRDHLMSRLIYLRDNDTGEYWNVNWEPVCKPFDSYECVHGLGYTIISSETCGIRARLRIFIPTGNDPLEIWTLTLEDIGGNARNLSLYVYTQFQFHYKAGFDSYGDMLYRGSDMDWERNSIVASKHPFRRPHNFLTAFLTSDEPIVAFEGSRDAFVGLYSSLRAPRAVIEGRCSNTPGSSDATIGAIEFQVPLAVGDSKRLTMMLGATDGTERIDALRRKYLGNEERFFEELRTEKAQLCATNHVTTPDPHFDRLLNGWIKQGNLFGATWCRWGYKGYRDIVQQGQGIAALQPERTRSILVSAFRHQYRNGLALRGWHPIDEKAYSDCALWLIYTLTTYLKETGDFAFLEEITPFYDEGEATVRAHIERALDFLETNKGAHQLCLIKFGDWNDSLTGVGKDGRGESVWLSMAYAEALREMARLMAHLGDYGAESDFTERRKGILDAINREAWDGRWYVRCFDDEGCAIGAHTNQFGHIFMESQSWALISGAASPERASELIASCDEILASEVGYLLLAPAFTEFDERVGRLSSLEPGICENGTIYSHVNIWMILGLLRYGKADKAYELFRKIAPGYIDRPGAAKENALPYMVANCYYGPSHRNKPLQMEFSWITGSLPWFNTVLAQEMLGVSPEYDGLTVSPCIPSTWKECKVERRYRNSTYNIIIRNPDGISSGKVYITFDGAPLKGNRLPLDVSPSSHDVELLIVPDHQCAKAADLLSDDLVTINN